MICTLNIRYINMILYDEMEDDPFMGFDILGQKRSHLVADNFEKVLFVRDNMHSSIIE